MQSNIKIAYPIIIIIIISWSKIPLILKSNNGKQESPKCNKRKSIKQNSKKNQRSLSIHNEDP